VAGIAIVWIATNDGADRPSTDRGRQLFSTAFGEDEGLGPLFNERSCAGCHAFPEAGGVGRDGLATVLRVGRLTDAGFDAMLEHGGPFAHTDAVCGREAGIPAGATVTSVRNAPSLFGDGLLAAIPDRVIRAGAIDKGDGVDGRPNVAGGEVGRFGWKADTPSLRQFVADAFRSELGVSSVLAPATAASRCRDEKPELDSAAVAAVTAFVAALPAPRPQGTHPDGAAVFDRIGCAACHTPELGGVPAYSDLLLHDMGPLLDDRVVQGSARGRDWRTAPLWGLADRPRLLHDGRAQTLTAAILAHGGEAAAARRRFRALTREDRRRLLAFLRDL
jgi:CxxC motif-containing protein (DUF1111 family)